MADTCDKSVEDKTPPRGRKACRYWIALVCKVFFLKRKLDWIYLHNLAVVQWGVEEEITVSDHRPVWVVVSLVR
jgi:endonuclease/exonuclease/phosphatase (EEP) superfamily protein YafD